MSIVPVVSIPPFLGLPRGVSQRTMATRGTHFAALSTQESGRSDRVLFVPGFTGSKEDFIAVLPLLGQARIHAVAYDQAGQHETLIHAEEDRFALAELAADVIALGQVIWPEGPRPHLVGHSLGGLVARAAVLSAPADFRSLTLLGSGPCAVPEHQQSTLHGLRAALPEMDLEQLWEVRQAMNANAGIASPPAHIEQFLRQRWLNSHPLSFRAKAEILLTEPDRVDELSLTGVPVCVTTGTADDVWPPEQQAEMAERLRGYHVRIQDAGHSPNADAPQATAAALLGFWSGLRRLADADVVGRATARASQLDQLLTEPIPAESGRQARAFTEAQLQRWGLQDLTDVVQLIASELVTNALHHGGGTADISLAYRRGVVRVEVRDHGGGEPELRDVPLEEESGRGMAIVDRLSQHWGVTSHPDGKTVWAEVAVPQDLDATDRSDDLQSS